MAGVAHGGIVGVNGHVGDNAARGAWRLWRFVLPSSSPAVGITISYSQPAAFTFPPASKVLAFLAS